VGSLRRFEGEKEEMMRKSGGRERGHVRAPCEGWGRRNPCALPRCTYRWSPMGEPLRDWQGVVGRRARARPWPRACS